VKTFDGVRCCSFCERSAARNHRTGATAFGLDYNPKDWRDAQRWLRRRRKELMQLVESGAARVVSVPIDRLNLDPRRRPRRHEA